MGENDKDFFEPVASLGDTLPLRQAQKKPESQIQPPKASLLPPEQILPMEDNSEEPRVAKPVIIQEKPSQLPSSEPSLDSFGLRRRNIVKGIFATVFSLSGITGLIYFLGDKAINLLQGKANQTSPDIRRLLEDSQFSGFLQKLKLSPQDDKLSDPAQKISDWALQTQICLDKCDQENWETLIVYAERGGDEQFLGQVVVLEGVNRQKIKYLNPDKTINEGLLKVDGLNDATKVKYVKTFNTRINLLRQQGKYKEVIP